jgi:hypothetical protein
MYRGRPVIDVFAKLSKRERKAKEKTLAEQHEHSHEESPAAQ